MSTYTQMKIRSSQYAAVWDSGEKIVGDKGGIIIKQWASERIFMTWKFLAWSPSLTGGPANVEGWGSCPFLYIGPQSPWETSEVCWSIHPTKYPPNHQVRTAVHFQNSMVNAEQMRKHYTFHHFSLKSTIRMIYSLPKLKQIHTKSSFSVNKSSYSWSKIQIAYDVFLINTFLCTIKAAFACV